MNKDLISVIVPVYNVEEYLNTCLESIVKQSYSNIEILLLDDGSTDNSGDLCEQWKTYDSRIKVIHKSNEGLAETRNRGLKEAKGKYIAWVDSDDYVDEHFLEVLYEQLKENDADISMCSFYNVYGDEVVFEAASVFFSEFLTVEEFLEKVYTLGAFSVVWNKLAEKEVYDNICFPRGRRFEDSSIMRKMAANCHKIIVSDRPLYYYRQREKSIMLSERTPEEAAKYLQERCRWAQDDIDVYRTEGKDKLLFLAAKFICNAIIVQYHELARRDKKRFKKKYNYYVKDVLNEKNCPVKVKMKYLVAYLSIDLYRQVAKFVKVSW